MLRASPDIEIGQEQLFSPLAAEANAVAAARHVPRRLRAPWDRVRIATGCRVDFTGSL
jgi:hypothetical protein